MLDETKQEIDKLLEQDACNYTNLGTDSTTEEIESVRRKSKRIYNKILKLDHELGTLLLKTFDERPSKTRPLPPSD